jgi:hypothetical protein
MTESERATAALFTKKLKHWQNDHFDACEANGWERSDETGKLEYVGISQYGLDSR